MRILLHSPKDMLAGPLAVAAVSAIIANALFLQAGRHPSPMFGYGRDAAGAPAAASPLPRPRPVELPRAATLPIAAAGRTKSVEPKSVEARSRRYQEPNPKAS